MKPKRRITSIYNKLLKAEQTEETLLALQILGWVLEDNDLKFEDIIYNIEEPAPRLSTDLFAYDAVQMVWAMKNPFNHNQVFIVDRVPDYTPKSWWELIDINKIEEEIVVETDYLRVRDHLQGETISWVEIPWCFEKYRDFFRKQTEAEAYLSHFFTIDYADRIEVSAVERRDFQQRTNCAPRSLRGKLEEEYKAKWVYTYKSKGERIWVMKKQQTE